MRRDFLNMDMFKCNKYSIKENYVAFNRKLSI